MHSKEKCRHLGEKLSQINIACETCGGINVTRNVRSCSIHGKCVPNFNPTGGLHSEWLAKTEAESITLCLQCPDYSPAQPSPS